MLFLVVKYQLNVDADQSELITLKQGDKRLQEKVKCDKRPSRTLPENSSEVHIYQIHEKRLSNHSFLCKVLDVSTSGYYD